MLSQVSNFLGKNKLLMFVIALIIVNYLLLKQLSFINDELIKSENNIESLATNFNDKITKIELKNGEVLNKITALNINSNDLKVLNNDLNNRLRKLNLKVDDLQSVTDVGINYKINIDSITSKLIVALNETNTTETTINKKLKSYKFNKFDDYMNIDGIINIDTTFKSNPYITKLELQTTDSLLIAPEIQYKRPWYYLWLVKKPVGLEMNIKSQNPHSDINYIKHYNFNELK